MKVFISHTTREPHDRALAFRVAEVLRLRGAEYFIAPDSIPAGDDWEERLVDAALRQCTHFFVIHSDKASESEWVQKEVSLAQKRERADPSFRLLALVTGQAATPFPNKQWVPRHENGRRQLDAITTAFGLPRATIEERLKTRALYVGDELAEGDLVPRLCNRIDQEDEFSTSFLEHVRRRPGVPQVFFIAGGRPDNHESFIQRVTAIHIQEYATFLHGDEGAAVPEHNVRWPRSTHARHVREEVLANLFGTLSRPHEYGSELPLTAAAFRQLLHERGRGARVFHHELLASAWSVAQSTALHSYLEFWNDVAREPLTHSMVVLFFRVVFDEAAPTLGLATKLARLTAWLNAWPLSVAELSRLSCVREIDVTTWLDQRAWDCDADERDQLCRTLFGSSKCEPMSRIEYRLRDIHRKYIARRRATA